ncbi:formamidopyrimidine-DNA glycosylase [Companilactobacillus crustorum]|uniref:Formamidopyrimidine-DNA glycosylase n=3 Tax=Companilactobacillus TaxID=2767879 RepID=A0A837RG62_9LACO|nr:DNA-formamidopyrimidine glycosylase [Companilactobacillus crustorum]HCD07315.1 DNA-formamidopyrimidine glycosylase [Lactobacillus sp.]APU71093.1 Formamidopyrimidine-DNA glycosylase [Companilactobacillus crustorum]KRK41931.1 formamidopyrimidine 5-formyluracil 5-hydroxymethyluracil DNA glycosylase [Companilactobacillus crustorum JCM 15951]KRO19940.1 formamidopyrimidine 5-formyluracil 5-hydroxymethyluracil DNA glycosylase [Companilactobacillus crustorum]WDT64664.1 DNA-formamidopyrimidine glyco
MPEMPEVETVRRGLNSQVKGRKITNVEIRYPDLITGDVNQFIEFVTDATITDVGRRAKFLLIHLNNGYTIISHLRMEGRYRISADPSAIDKHSHAIFTLDNGQKMIYNDVRKFGRMQLWNTDDLDNNKSLQKLGPEPLSKTFTFALLKPRIMRHHKDIKTVLLDQSVMSGLGNIYVDEVLWKAKIHPQTPSNHLSDTDIQNIIELSNQEMKKAIEAGGSTIRSYIDATGHKGNMQNSLKVYGKEGTPCPRCGTNIVKIKVSGRGTHFCPKCQVIK